MRDRLRRFLASAYSYLQSKLAPKLDQSSVIRELLAQLKQVEAVEDVARLRYMERVQELVEARQMAGSGPWRIGPETASGADQLIEAAYKSFGQPRDPLKLQEAVTPVGAFGDISLALENVKWRREISFSWLEFSRWGIQQIILISRLYYLKNPMIRRAINVVAAYVMARGVEVSSDDPDADEVIKEFFEDNQATLGQGALVELTRQKLYDGNLFFAFFSDKLNTGQVKARTIDATEIMEIVTDPDDSDKPQLYKRSWTQQLFNQEKGSTSTESVYAWYPALGHNPTEKPEMIGTVPVKWDTPVYHRKDGGIAKWHFGCPRSYPALDWSKAAKELLENCATIRRSLAQVAMTLTTKGGQQALQGAKGQLQTTVGAGSNVWDANPTATAGSIFASGPGTTLAAFNSKGAGGDPSDVKEYRNQVAICYDVPPTFLGDMETSNLSTATTLDRPTELAMLLHQAAWEEDLTIIARYVLSVSEGAAGGKLREARAKRPQSQEVAIIVNFPAIVEGDMPARVHAIAEAMTLDNKGGQIVGIDEKTGVELLFQELGVEDFQDIVDKMYPKKIFGKPGRAGYDPDRTKEPIAAPIPKAVPNPGGIPQAPPGDPTPAASPATAKTAEALARLLEAVRKLPKKAA